MSMTCVGAFRVRRYISALHFRSDFHDQETDLRSIVVAEFDDASPDHLWVVAGLAQADRRVPGQSWVRLLDSMRYIPS